MAQPKGFLDLPQEIRDEIYEYIVVKPTNTITMLENHNCFQNEVSAGQPAISRVNRQIRAESLPMFYRRNLFMAELSNYLDLTIAKSWLESIGDLNAGCIRRLALCGWTKVEASPRAKIRLWIRVLFNVKDGTLEVEGNEPHGAGQPTICKDMGAVKGAFRALVEARDGRPFDVAALSDVMEGFHRCCANCSEEEKKVDGSYRTCDSECGAS